jgi:hypothetical protein
MFARKKEILPKIYKKSHRMRKKGTWTRKKKSWTT